MNLHHLRYFITLAHLEHYTRASEELAITQPSLSHAISSLEQELGVSLFEKEGRNIVLTKYGKIFLADVKKSIEILESGINTLKITSTGAGRIDLAFLRTLGTNFVPLIIRKFLDKNKDKPIQFHFHTGVTMDILQGLKEKKYDVAICSKVENEPHIEFTPIAMQELVLIVPKGHPLALKDSIDLKETLSYPQIIFTKKSGLRPIIDELFNKIGEHPLTAFEIEEDQVIAGMVAQDFGIAIVPNMHILKSLNVKVIKILSPSYERMFYLAVMKNKYLAPVVNDFKNFIIAQGQNKNLEG